MTKPIQDDGLALYESLYADRQETDSNIADPDDFNNFFGLPSLGNAYRDERNLAMLLATLSSGMETYIEVFEALERKYGHDVKRIYLQEVNRNG